MTVYIKHYIKSEADLPKEDGYYLICFRRLLKNQMDYTIEFKYKANIDKKDVLKAGLYWLEEIELPTDQETHEYAFYRRSEELYTQELIDGFEIGVNWLKSKLR